MKLQKVIKKTAKNSDNFELYWKDFLDYYFRCDKKQKKEIVREEPENFKELSKQRYAFIAAAVEKLCNDYNITPPDWIFKDKYFLKDPMFALNARGDLRLFLYYFHIIYILFFCIKIDSN